MRPPSDWVQRFASLVPPAAPVLDVACGSGRHVRLFAERGHPVRGVDRDLGEAALLSGRAGIELVELDLETDPPPSLGEAAFGGVVVTNYLHRALFPALLGAVAAGGVLIYETFAVGNERFGRPRSPDFLLRPGELLERCRGALCVVAYEHGLVEGSSPRVVQRICAVRGSATGDEVRPLPAAGTERASTGE